MAVLLNRRDSITIGDRLDYLDMFRYAGGNAPDKVKAAAETTTAFVPCPEKVSTIDGL